MLPTTIRIDEKTKQSAKRLANQLGLNFNALINALLKKAVREGGVDLRHRVLTENGFTPDFEMSIIDAEKEGDAMEFDSIDAMIEHAKNED